MTLNNSFLLSRTKLIAYLFATLLTIGLWTITLFQLHLARDMHVEMTQRNLVSVTRSLHAHATRTIQLAEQAAVLIQREYLRDGSSLDLNQLIAEKALTEDIFTLFTVVDHNANVALSSRPFEHVNLSDREHIKIHFLGDSGKLFVGRPVIGRVSGKASIQFTRRISGADGGFGGVVVVSMDPFYFTDVYGSLGLGSQSAISLVRNDGLILVTRSDGQQAIGLDVTQSPVYMHIINSGKAAGVFENQSPLDGIDRLWSYQMLDDMPLYVSVGVNIDEELKPFYEMSQQIYILATLISLIIYGFAFSFGQFFEKLRESRQSAIDASKAKTEFLSNVSHELRTPINGILGYAELLEIKESDPEKATFLRYIQQSGNHLLSLVNSLLALNSIEKGQIEVSNKREKLQSILQEVVNAHQQKATEKELSLSLYIASDVPEYVICDRVKMLQILHNLVHNAIKFTDTGGVQVHASLRKPEISSNQTGNPSNTPAQSPEKEQFLEIAVKDTGCGIAPEHLKTVFDRFFQTNAGTAEGFGLGLSIVRQLARLMQSDIHVVSELGKGSTFTVSMPLKARGMETKSQATRKNNTRRQA